MTVECPGCNTTFPVDPHKVPSGGVHARCSVCQAVFFVEVPEPVFEPVTVAAEEMSAITEALPVEGEVVPIEVDAEAEFLEAEFEAAPDELGEEDDGPVFGQAVIVEDEDEVEAPAEMEETTFGEPEPTFGEAEFEAPVVMEETTFGEPEPTFGEAEFQAPVVMEETTFGEPEPTFGDGEATFSTEETDPGIDLAAEAPTFDSAVPELPYDEPVFSAEEVTPEPVAEAPVETPAPLPTPSFGRRDPKEKAQRLARVLVSDIILYNPDRHKRALDAGTLKEDFGEEIDKSWSEYVEQVGEEIANSTDFFAEALNEILAKGKDIF